MRIRICLTLIVLLSGSIVSAAQDESAGAAATPAAEFARLSGEFRTLVAKLNQIRKQYRADPDADKGVLETEWQQKLEEVRMLERKLAASAMKAYLAAPGDSSTESEYLFAYLAGQVQADKYEQAVRVVKVLDDNGYKHKYFNLLAGLSHFATMDFENAKKYLTLAKDEKEIDANGMRYLNLIDQHNYPAMWEQEQALREAEDKADNLPKVKLETSKGDIVVALFEDQAPIATANFINLAEKGFYDGLKFHRVIPGFMAQGGDPSGDGSGGPGYTIPDECYEDDHRSHFRGTLSMANTGQRDTGGSQFFLTFQPTAHLDGKHTVFGRVVEGMDVLAELQRCQPGDSATPDRITKATVISKRNHPYVPVTRPDP